MKDQIINNSLVLLELDTDNFEDVVRAAGARFEANGNVKDTYIEAVIAREKISPTGLRTESHSFGMPHTDPSHVLKAGVCFVRTKKPVIISMMGDLDTKFEADMFYVLAISDPAEYMSFLSQLMGLFQDENTLEILSNTCDENEVIEIISKLNWE